MDVLAQDGVATGMGEPVTQANQAWFELYPGAPNAWPFLGNPGNIIDAYSKYLGGTTYAFYEYDSTTGVGGFAEETVPSGGIIDNYTVEAIMERPTVGGQPSVMAQFSPLTFQDVYVGSGSTTLYNAPGLASLEMTQTGTSTGQELAGVTSVINSSGGFTVGWDHCGSAGT
jgi:hypothetical protein